MVQDMKKDPRKRFGKAKICCRAEQKPFFFSF